MNAAKQTTDGRPRPHVGTGSPRLDVIWGI
jgi:hypothetical protein